MKNKNKLNKEMNIELWKNENFKNEKKNNFNLIFKKWEFEKMTKRKIKIF